ncbi:UNVERIFIED_CONTAM: hypothetical protein GTU68_008310 [Idotea baltica]|nr:hypothetical protein [Idotea baltica]
MLSGALFTILTTPNSVVSGVNAVTGASFSMHLARNKAKNAVSSSQSCSGR